MKRVHFPRFDDKPAAERVEADLIICWCVERESRPERHDPAWNAIRDGVKIFALKVQAVASCP
jgi:hypothetical protein